MYEEKDMTYIITLENKNKFYFKPLTGEDIGKARQLCDECVGENLYSEEDIAATISAEDNFFYLINNEDGDSIGYLYYRVTDIESLAKYSKLDVSVFREVYPQTDKRVGKIQSIGLKYEYRGIGLGSQIMRFAVNRLRAESVDIAFGFCWKPKNKVPIGKVIEECNFTYLTEATMIWYDYEDLICPYCHGRCTCGADVYYKMINEERYNEA